MDKKEITAGQKFNRLTIIREIEPKKRKDRNSGYYRMVLCECDCGNTKELRYCHLSSGKVKSCGCIRKEVSAESARKNTINLIRKNHPTNTQGYIKTYPYTYTSWKNMRGRCLLPNNSGYHLYGGRGITVCERWDNFYNFLQDMGERPKGYTLDRIDSNGNYEPSNCRWATPKEQSLNKRDSLLVCPICGYEINNGCLGNMKQHIEYKHPSK